MIGETAVDLLVERLDATCEEGDPRTEMVWRGARPRRAPLSGR